MLKLKIWHFFDRILQRLSALQRQIPLIYPESKGKVVWDTILCGIRLYFMFVIPIQLAFPQELLYSSLLMVTLLFTCVLVIDVIISFYTPYYEFG
jgi:potassium voltage-gated channel Eag-related subfamily H protein 7